MPKRDRAYMAERRDEIIDAAIECLMKHGLVGFSTTALCKEAGISMGALYTHFHTKDDVLGAIAERTARQWRGVYDFHNAAEMRARLLNLADRVFSSADNQKFRVDVELILAGLNDERIAAVFRDQMETRELTSALARLVRVGELKGDVDPHIAATAIVSLLTGAHMFRLMGAQSSAPFAGAMELLLKAIIGPEK